MNPRYQAYKRINFDLRGHVMTVTMNNPDALNCTDKQMHAELSRVFIDLADDEDVHVVVLTGAGNAFSAGGDVQHMKNMILDPAQFQLAAVEGKRIVNSLLDLPQPIICRLNGDAIGLGATLALFCDIVIAVDTAKIADPHVRVGFVAGDGGAVIWPQLIGFARAKQYLLTGDALTAQEAAQLGLINFSVAADSLDAKVDEWSSRFARGARRSIQWTKATINTELRRIAATVLETGFAYEALSNSTSDHAEAVDAFLQKRKPSFTGN